MELKKINSENIDSFVIQLYSANVEIEQNDSNNIIIETDATYDQD
ncbi:MAG: hypothetical protein ACK4YF_04935 [Exilispira sp.]